MGSLLCLWHVWIATIRIRGVTAGISPCEPLGTKWATQQYTLMGYQPVTCMQHFSSNSSVGYNGGISYTNLLANWGYMFTQDPGSNGVPIYWYQDVAWSPKYDYIVVGATGQQTFLKYNPSGSWTLRGIIGYGLQSPPCSNSPQISHYYGYDKKPIAPGQTYAIRDGIITDNQTDFRDYNTSCGREYNLSSTFYLPILAYGVLAGGSGMMCSDGCYTTTTTTTTSSTTETSTTSTSTTSSLTSTSSSTLTTSPETSSSTTTPTTSTTTIPSTTTAPITTSSTSSASSTISTTSSIPSTSSTTTSTSGSTSTTETPLTSSPSTTIIPSSSTATASSTTTSDSTSSYTSESTSAISSTSTSSGTSTSSTSSSGTLSTAPKTTVAPTTSATRATASSSTTTTSPSTSTTVPTSSTTFTSSSTAISTSAITTKTSASPSTVSSTSTTMSWSSTFSSTNAVTASTASNENAISTSSTTTNAVSSSSTSTGTGAATSTSTSTIITDKPTTGTSSTATTSTTPATPPLTSTRMTSSLAASSTVTVTPSTTTTGISPSTQSSSSPASSISTQLSTGLSSTITSAKSTTASATSRSPSTSSKQDATSLSSSTPFVKPTTSSKDQSSGSTNFDTPTAGSPNASPSSTVATAAAVPAVIQAAVRAVPAATISPTTTATPILVTQSASSSSSSAPSSTVASTSTHTPDFSDVHPNVQALFAQLAINDSFEQSVLINSILPYYVRMINQTLLANVTIPWSKIFIKCYYEGIDCMNELNFQLNVTATYGSCYTFNFDITNRRMTHRSGRKNGLTLVLESLQDEYLCTSESAGFRFSLQEPTKPAFPETNGFYVSPGALTSVIITRDVHIKIDDCVNEPDRTKYYYEGGYRTEGCLRSCYQDFVIQHCDCADPRYPKPATARYCSLNDTLCLEGLMDCDDEFMRNMDCQCQDPCHFYYYDVSISTSRLQLEPMRLDGACDRMNMSSRNRSCSEYIGNNIAYVEIFYDRLTQIEYAEDYAYSLDDFLIDLSSILGAIYNIGTINAVELVVAVAAAVIPGAAYIILF